MELTSECHQALTATGAFLRRMTTWALPSDVRAEVDSLLAAHTTLFRKTEVAGPTPKSTELLTARPAESHVTAQTEQDRPFPGNLRERLPEWTLPDECPPIPFDIDQALNRIKLVDCQTSWQWFWHERENELGGLLPASAIEFIDGAEALRQMLWRMSNPLWNGDAPTRRVAFLGVDGVVYPKTRRPPKSFESLKRHVDANVAIERLTDCLSAGGLDVVVHCHWRPRLTRAQLLELLRMEDGGFGGTSGCACCSSGSFLIGTTLSTLDAEAGIRDAISRMRLAPEDYIVIDSDTQLLAAFPEQAVCCEASRGIDDAFVVGLYERVGVRLVRL